MSDGSMFIIVIPIEGQTVTEVEFIYWFEGEELNAFDKWTSEHFSSAKGKAFLGLSILFILSVLAIIIGTSMYYCKSQK